VSAEITWGDPETLFAHWTQPELLTLWWPPEAEIGREVGEAYHLIWNGAGETIMRGTITAFEPGRELGFTWKWSFESADAEPLDVRVAFEPLAGEGARIDVRHGPVEEGSAKMNGLLSGWNQFLGQLQNLPEASEEPETGEEPGTGEESEAGERE
jgi:uncharacterized protein YndB with AHSA1/START domain